MSNASHAAKASAHLATAEKQRAELEALYNGPHDRTRVADLHDRIRWNLRAAEVHALLAQVEDPKTSRGVQL